MKNKAGYFWIATAVFVGAFGALQLDRQLRPNDAVERMPVVNELNVTPVSMEQTPGAPIDFRAAAKRVKESVVSVDRFERFRRGFMDSRVVEAETGTGSGVIIDSSGIIVTNNHVVEAGMSRNNPTIKVRLSDGRTLDAKLLGRDPRSDLAVLKVEASNLKPIQLGQSKDVEVGQWVLAVGNPLGFDSSVSVGVVSSLKRNLPVGQSGLVDALQTDAAINPGNSGGALTDASGRLIGINSAIASGTGQSVGIGFAIPVDRMKTVVNDIVKFGEARYAGLGMSYDPRYDGALANGFFRRDVEQQFQVSNLPSSGILILEPGSELTRVGAKPGSVLQEIAGEKVESSFDLNRILTPRKPGETVSVKFWSEGQTKTAQVKLVELRQST